MKTKQLVVRSAVTVVATGLTLLLSGTSEANGRGPSGMRMSGGRGGMGIGTMRQSISPRGMNRGSGVMSATGRINSNRGLMTGRGERQRGDDRGRGHHRERGDNRGGNASITRGERDPGDDHGLHREREPGDDHGGGR